MFTLLLSFASLLYSVYLFCIIHLQLIKGQTGVCTPALTPKNFIARRISFQPINYSYSLILVDIEYLTKKLVSTMLSVLAKL